MPLPLPAKEALKEAGVRERMPAKAMEMYQREIPFALALLSRWLLAPS